MDLADEATSPGEQRRLRVLELRALEDAALAAYDRACEGLREHGEEPTGAREPRLLTVQEAAELARVHANTVYQAASSGQLRSRRVGRMLRFTHEDVLAWTEARP